MENEGNTNSGKPVLISPDTEREFLLALKDYIEHVEAKIEGEWGCGRSINEIEMPDIYYDVLERLEKTTDGDPIPSNAGD